MSLGCVASRSAAFSVSEALAASPISMYTRASTQRGVVAVGESSIARVACASAASMPENERSRSFAASRWQRRSVSGTSSTRRSRSPWPNPFAAGRAPADESTCAAMTSSGSSSSETGAPPRGSEAPASSASASAALPPSRTRLYTTREA